MTQSLEASQQAPHAQPQHWAIVGGGILGMTLAHRLAQAGQRVTLVEAAPEIGGLASAWQFDDLYWDRHYHVTLLSDFQNRQILTELGLEKDMRWVETKTGVYADGQLYSVSNAIEFLKFPPLGLIDKIRLAMTIVWGSKITDWRKLEQISVSDWLKRWSGNRTFRKFWLPLLRAKLGDNYTKASAAFIWATIYRLYAARRNGLKKELFGYLPGGYGRMLKRFGDVLQKEGVEIRLGQPVHQVYANLNQQPCLDLASGETLTFDQVVITAAAPIAAKLCPQLNDHEVSQLNAIEYQGILCASMLLKKPISPYYVTNITEENVPFTGIIEMTALVDRDAEFGGRSLIYLPKYIPSGSADFSLTDAELEEQFISAIEGLYPEFDRRDVLNFQVSRVKYVMALSTLNYSKTLPSMHTSVPGVHIVNSAHIVNATLNVNDTIQLAERAVPELLSQAQIQAPSPSKAHA
jgi:protoporphyrinogen oxidase